MHKYSLLLFVVVAAVCGGQTSPAAGPLLDADRAFNKATQTNRLEGWMSYMADNVVLFGQNPPVAGKEAVRKFYEPQFAKPAFTLAWEPKIGEMQPSGKVGFTSGRWTVRVKNADGNTAELHGSYLTVWGKQKDGSWKVIADGGSADLAPAQSPE